MRKSDLKRHSQLHSKPQKCEVCGNSFTRKHDLKRHCTIHEKPHESKECGESFTGKHDLKRRCTIHEKLKKHECEICGISFERESALQIHLQNTRKRSFKCEVCDKTITLKGDLKRHLLIHKGKRFLRNSRLTFHLPKTCEKDRSPPLSWLEGEK